MWQFLLGSDNAYDALETRARRACVTYGNQELPPGSNPTHATVGFEVDSASGVATLFVTRGVSYAGTNDDIGAWLAAGRLRFPSFRELRAWLCGILRPAYLAPRSPSLRTAHNSTLTSEIKAATQADSTDERALEIAMLRIARGDVSSS